MIRDRHGADAHSDLPVVSQNIHFRTHFAVNVRCYLNSYVYSLNILQAAIMKKEG